MKLLWKPLALEDRERIMAFIARDNPVAALDLDLLFEQTADLLASHPLLYKTGRIHGSREAVVHPNYVMVYTVAPKKVVILRILHAAQNWPP
ncbi:Addiction module toxin, RelE/StbE [Oxalobacteraceae bacterium IMCC9480]|nr:Addiction module toxin, RelE/StbE [Oxalobacteraceae bacterium IMCC9480]